LLLEFGREREFASAGSFSLAISSAIDFHVQVLGLSFHDAMRQVGTC
jgi:hypothetical protein